MSSRFLHSLVAAAALQAACAGGVLAAEPVSGLVVAQLGPTSPGFKMGVNRSETGAPEATAIGAMPIEKKPTAGKGAEWRSKSSHPSAEKEEEDKAKAGKAGGRKTEARVEGDEPGDEARPGKAGAAASGASAMDILREKLAAKLGARPAADGKYAMQVSNRGESGEKDRKSVV